MKSTFYDGIYQINAHAGVVKMNFINVKSNEKNQNEVVNSDEVVITVGSFFQFVTSVNEIAEKLRGAIKEEAAKTNVSDEKEEKMGIELPKMKIKKNQ